LSAGTLSAAWVVGCPGEEIHPRDPSVTPIFNELRKLHIALEIDFGPTFFGLKKAE
jgi:hypothetical protein